MRHRENRFKRLETRSFPKHLIDVKNKQRIAAPIEKVAVRIGTHTLHTVPVCSRRSIVSIENSVSPRVERKGHMFIMVGKVLKKIGSRSLSQLANEIME